MSNKGNGRQKIEMFREVPEGFHNSLVQALQGLPKEKARHFSMRRAAIIAVAAVMLLGVMTAAAAELFKWNPLMRERAGADPEIEAELTMKGRAREEQSEANAEGVEIRVIQSMRTARGFYFLMEMSVPEGITVDGDTLVDKCSVECEKELGGLVCNIASPEYLSEEAAGLLQDDTYYLEVTIYAQEGIDYGETEAVICLENLIQTEKTEQTKLLVEGVWRLPVTLYGDLDTVCFYGEQTIAIGDHVLEIQYVQANPFELRIFCADNEAARHAVRYSTAQVTGVRMTDGRVIEQESNALYIGFAKTDAGEGYIRVGLSQAVLPGQLAAALVNGGEAEIILQQTQDMTDNTERQADRMADLPQENTVGMDLEAELQAGGYTCVYEREGWAVTANETMLELWDVDCNARTILADLKALGYDAAKGGSIEAGPGGNLITMVPAADSTQSFLILVNRDGGELVREMDRAKP